MHKETHGFDAVRFLCRAFLFYLMVFRWFLRKNDPKMTLFADGDLSDFAVQ